jgi:Concanavalin A-like lectin/glucanases superfamily
MQTGRIEMMKLRFGIMAALGLWYAAATNLGCSISNNGQTPTGGTIHSTTGGGAGNGAAGSAGNGAAGSVGSSAGGTSTSPSTGGSTQNASGGIGASAGSAAGGTSAAGGSATGGANAAGGSATGGASAAGGSAAGGTSAAGGSATAGKTVTGGSATGGTSSAGGSTPGGATVAGGSAAGGATKTGGATSGGASGSATGGSAAGGSTGGSQGGTSNTSASSGGSASTGACAPRVLSLSSNATASAADTAYSHVEVDMGSDLPIGNAARTVEFWAYIKTTDWVGEKNELYYIGAATGAASASTFGLDFGTNAVAGTSNHATLNPFTNGLNDDTDVDLGINSSTDQWVHVAMTWDQKALVTYVNGVAKITDNATTAIPKLNTSQSTLYIGCNPSNKNCFNGEFAEFRVWNVARSAADILANYKKPMVGNEAGLVGYWKFDDAATATSAADSVTTTGHTAHPGTLKATTAAQNPTFVAPSPAVPITCP